MDPENTEISGINKKEPVSAPEENSITLESELKRLQDVSALGEGAKRNFYWQMKGICFGGGNQLYTRTVGEDWQMIPDKKDQETGQARSFILVKYLGFDRPDKKPYQINREDMQGPRLELHFTLEVDKKTIDDEEESLGSHGPKMYTTRDIYHFDEAKIGDGALHTSWTERAVAGKEEGVTLELNEGFKIPNADNLTAIDPQKLHSAIDGLLKPEETFQEQAKIVVEAAKDKKITPVAAKKLIQAIREFGNYMYKRSEDHKATNFIGECLTIPLEFNIFCKIKFGIKIDDITPIANLPSEELFAGGEREPLSSTHILNACGSLGIDWTARQYGGDLPFPEVFRIDRTKQPYYVKLSPTFRQSIVYVPRSSEELLIRDKEQVSSK